MAMRELIFLVGRAPRRRVLLLVLLTLLTGLTDGVGLLLLVPLLGVIGGGSAAKSAEFIQGMAEQAFLNLGIPLSLLSILSVFILLIAVRSALVLARDALSKKLQHDVVDSLRRECFDAILRAEWRWITPRRQSDHASLLITDISRVGTGLHFGLLMVLGIASLIAYLRSAFLLSWVMTLVVTMLGAVMLLLMTPQRRRTISMGVGVGISNKEVQGVVS